MESGHCVVKTKTDAKFLRRQKSIITQRVRTTAFCSQWNNIRQPADFRDRVFGIGKGQTAKLQRQWSKRKCQKVARFSQMFPWHGFRCIDHSPSPDRRISATCSTYEKQATLVSFHFIPHYHCTTMAVSYTHLTLPTIDDV